MRRYIIYEYYDDVENASTELVSVSTEEEALMWVNTLNIDAENGVGYYFECYES